MRGGDVPKFRISQFNGKNLNIFLLSICTHRPTVRYPSSVSLAGSEKPSRLPASPRGKPRGASFMLLPFNKALCSVSFESIFHSLNRPKLWQWVRKPTYPYRVRSVTLWECHRYPLSYPRFLSSIVTGRVRELPYRYNPRSVVKKKEKRTWMKN